MLDVIIPVFNEERCLRESAEYFQSLGRHANLIFVDGGSKDLTVKVAEDYGQVFVSGKSRCLQKNRGARHSVSEKMLFLHVDSRIDIKTLDNIERILDYGYCGGCLTMRMDDRGLLFVLFEILVNFGARHLKFFDGDLGLFVTKKSFYDAGGFDSVTVMEDVFFGKKLLRVGRTIILDDKIIASTRRWKEQGFLNVLSQYSKTYLKYFLGLIKPIR